MNMNTSCCADLNQERFVSLGVSDWLIAAESALSLVNTDISFMAGCVEYLVSLGFIYGLKEPFSESS